MNLHRSGRKALITLLAVASLALPTSALADSQSGTVSENLDVAASISATFPGTQVYSGTAHALFPATTYETGEGLVSIVSSNAANGVTIKAKVSVYHGPGAITVPTTARKAAISGYSTVGTGATLDPTSASIAAGTWANDTTDLTIAGSTGPVAGRQIGVVFAADKSAFSTAGSYSATVTYTASTNP